MGIGETNGGNDCHRLQAMMTIRSLWGLEVASLSMPEARAWEQDTGVLLSRVLPEASAGPLGAGGSCARWGLA